ncbi:porin [Photobacterium sp.]|uniref:porin n=1 Tax=Photobacterium sp. TaxID=660 RepID=UPI00299D1F90|nr:porin [Photobacterium sp.]MDX1304066.1 porin [Photobacterium sp.]
MKKTLLAVAIPSLLFATSANAVEIFKSDEGFADFYGQLRTEVKKLEDKDVTLNAGSSRAGVTAQYKLTDTVDVFGKVEFGLNYKTKEKDYAMKNRLHYAGVDTDVGKFTFGRQWVVSDDTWGADYSYFFGGSALRHATLSGARHDSLIKYNYEGESFWVAGNYGLSEDDTNQELAELYAGTSLGDFNLHFGGGQNRDKAYKVGTHTIEEVKDKVTGALTTLKSEEDVKADLQNTYFEGTVEYTVGAALIGFTYYNAELESQGGQKIKENGYSVGGTYSWTDKATTYAGFDFTDQDASESSLKDGDSKGFHIGSVYHFNKWARIYAEYAYADGRTLGYSNKGSDTTIAPTEVDSESKFAIGARVYW